MRASRVELILNYLLIIGSLVAIATIDGGKWWRNDFVLTLSGVEVPWEYIYQTRAAFDGDVVVTQPPGPAGKPSGSQVCIVTQLPQAERWDETYLMYSEVYGESRAMEDDLLFRECPSPF